MFKPFYNHKIQPKPILIQQHKMPRSPSQDHNRPKRDFHRKESDENFYESQSRKKVHRSNEFNPRQPVDDRQRYPRHYEERAIQERLNKKRVQIMIEVEQHKSRVIEPESQLKVHFKFRPIKVKLSPQHIQQLIKTLKNHITNQTKGCVEYFKESFESRPGNLIFQLGFRHDNDAFSFLKSPHKEMNLIISQEKIKFVAEPSKAFKLLIDEKKRRDKSQKRSSKSRSQEKRKKKKHSNKKSKSSRSRSFSQSNSSRSSYKSSRPRYEIQSAKSPTPQRKEGKKNQSFFNPENQSYSNPRPLRSPAKQSKKYKKLYFLGIHDSVKTFDIKNLLDNHEQGPFRYDQVTWHKINGSICEFLLAKIEQKDAIKLLQIRDKLQICGHPFIVFDSQSMELQKLKNKIAQFQINIQFPKKIQPYYMLKGMKQCGRVVQIISNNKLSQQGKCDFYNVTFNSTTVCEQLKKLGKTPKSILIQGATAETALLVYRPNFKTELMSVTQDGKNRKYRSPGEEKARTHQY